MAQPPTSLEALLAEAPFLRALARSLVHGDAEDLVQETWLRALSSPPRHTRSLRGWLATVAFNLLRTSGRQNQRRAAAEAAAAPMPAAPSPVEILAYQEQLAKVAQAVRELPEPCRLVLHLRYHEECAPPEIARRLGEPLDTVKSRLKRALQLLRERLDKEHGGVRSAWRLALFPFIRPLDFLVTRNNSSFRGGFQSPPPSIRYHPSAAKSFAGRTSRPRFSFL